MMKNIQAKTDDGIALLSINRPDKLNALNNKTIEELHLILNDFNNDKEIKVVIITGSGNKAFVAGADIKEFASYSKKEGEKLARNGQKKLFDFIENYSKPIIAAINGFALGGGLELAMACHIRLASENAKMGLPEVSLGVIPGYGGTQRLAQLVGKGKAFEMITTGNMISAEQALEHKLVNYLETQENLMSKCYKIANQIIKNSPKAISAALKSINAGFNSEINGFEVEINSFSSCFQSDEFIEGTNAFLEKRKPNF